MRWFVAWSVGSPARHGGRARVVGDDGDARTMASLRTFRDERGQRGSNLVIEETSRASRRHCRERVSMLERPRASMRAVTIADTPFMKERLRANDSLEEICTNSRMRCAMARIRARSDCAATRARPADRMPLASPVILDTTGVSRGGVTPTGFIAPATTLSAAFVTVFVAAPVAFAAVPAAPIAAFGGAAAALVAVPTALLVVDAAVFAAGAAV